MESHPHAIVARVNFFGWSLSGERSLAEFFFNRLSAGQTVPGHADRYFTPMLVTDVSQLLLSMLAAQLSGLYHVGGAERLSKYEFGLRLARRFALDESLISPISWQDQGLEVPRSPDLSLNSGKLAKALGRKLPDVTAGLDGLYQQYQAGYPQQLRAMQTQSQAAAA